MTNLADLLPAGGGQNNTDFVADGTISSGAPVILTAAGKAAPIVATTATEAVGTEAVYYNSTMNMTSTAFDSTNNRAIFVYKNQGAPFYVRCVIGTVNGTGAMTYGTEVVLNSTTNSYPPEVVFDSNAGKAVVFYYEGSSLIGRVGTVDPSDNSISFGSPVTVATASGSAAYLVACFDTTNNQICVVFTGPSGGKPYNRVVTVNGTSLTLGTETAFGGNSDGWYAITYDSGSNKIIFAFQDSSSSYYASCMVGEISGSAASFSGLVYAFDSSGISGDIGCSYDSTANKTVFVWRDGGQSNRGKAIVGTVTGATSITFGAEVDVNSGRADYLKPIYDPIANKTIVLYSDYNYPAANNFYGRLVVGTISGTNLTFASTIDFHASATKYITGAYDSTSNVILISYQDNGNADRGTAKIFRPDSVQTNLTSTNLLGIASGAISDTATGTINTWGSRNEAQTGLTIGSDYYVQDDGRIEAGVTNIAYDISSATYTQNFSVSSQSTDPVGLVFSPDGTSMYVVSGVYPPGAKNIFQYALTTAFDISTASLSKDFDSSGQDSQARGIQFNADGTKMFINGVTGDAYYQYSLSSAYDISTGSYDSVSFSLSSQDGNMEDVVFNAAGTKFYGVGLNTFAIYQYSCSSAFDLSTASYDSVSFSISSQDNSPRDLFFKPDGSKMWLLGRQNNSIYQYSLSSAFDLSTASYDSISFSVSSEETSSGGLAFSANGEKFYVCGGTGDDVNQYATTANSFSTTYLIGQAITATQINIKDYTG